MGKGALTILSVLAVLSCLLLAGVGGAIAPTGGDVYVEETVLAGDPAAAQGLYVSAEYHCEYQMHWRTRFPVGHLEEQETEFSYTTAGTGFRVYPYDIGLQVGLYDSNYFLSLHDDGELEPRGSNQSRILPLVEEVVKNAIPHEGPEPLNDYFYAESIPLEDRFDDLPLSFQTWHVPFLLDEQLNVLEDYFRIPIPQGLTLRFAVAHGSSWYCVDVGLVGETLELGCDTVVLDEENREDLLFAISLEHCSVPLDGSLIPGGWGIYRLTCVKDENQVLQTPKLATVYTVPQGERVFRFWASQDKRDLFLLTLGEDQMLRLTVLDGETFAPRQTLDLFLYPQGQAVTFPGEEGYSPYVKHLTLCRIFQEEDYLAIPTTYDYYSRSYMADNGAGVTVWDAEGESAAAPPVGLDEMCAQLALVVRDEDGAWRLRFVADTSTLEREGMSMDIQGSYSDRNHIAFDGTRLALTGISTQYDSAYVAVWSGPELDFLGTYRHSLERSYGEPYCRLAEDGPPWRVSWRG